MDLGGGHAGDFGVGGAVGVVAGFAEAGGVGGEEFGGVAGDGVGEGGDAAFDVDFEVEGGVGVGGFGEFDDDGAAGGSAEGVFVNVAETYAAEDDAAVGGLELHVPDGDVGAGVAPRPEVEGVGGDVPPVTSVRARPISLRPAVSRGTSSSSTSGMATKGAPGERTSEMRSCSGDEPADFEAFADGEFGLLAVGVVDDVGSDVVARDAAAVELGVDEDVGEDEGVGGLGDCRCSYGAGCGRQRRGGGVGRSRGRRCGRGRRGRSAGRGSRRRWSRAGRRRRC